MKITLIRLIINFILSGVIILIFRNLNWIHFDKPPQLVADPAMNDLIIASIIGFVMFAIGEIAGITFQLFVVFTCGMGCLLYPVFTILLGYIKLAGTQILLPEWFSFDITFLKVAIISLAIGIVRIPSIKERKKTVVVRKRE